MPKGERTADSRDSAAKCCFNDGSSADIWHRAGLAWVGGFASGWPGSRRESILLCTSKGHEFHEPWHDSAEETGGRKPREIDPLLPVMTVWITCGHALSRKRSRDGIVHLHWCFDWLRSNADPLAVLPKKPPQWHHKAESADFTRFSKNILPIDQLCQNERFCCPGH
jgi:hypothetical protein